MQTLDWIKNNINTNILVIYINLKGLLVFTCAFCLLMYLNI